MSNSKIVFHEAKYLTSATKLSELPADEGWEIGFIGRSNAGKSSALNTITGIKGLARTSSTPGRTQMINLFSLNDKHRLVDLPGYGYAKAPRLLRERWEKTTELYLSTRCCLHGLILIMDIRHPLKEMDQTTIARTISNGIPVHVLLTKADKLSTSAARKVLKEVAEALKIYGDQISLQIFSSLTRAGLPEAQDRLLQWFTEDN